MLYKYISFLKRKKLTCTSFDDDDQDVIIIIEMGSDARFSRYEKHTLSHT